MLHGVYQHVDFLLVPQIGRNIPDARIEDFWVEHAHGGKKKREINVGCSYASLEGAASLQKSERNDEQQFAGRTEVLSAWLITGQSQSSAS